MRDVTDAFFVPDGDRYVATEHTRGPWSSKHQHGGPPTALIAHVVERTTPGFTIARVSVDFLRPVPTDLPELTSDIDAKLRALGDRRWVLESIAEGEAVLDPQRVTQALVQLASNAVKHTGAGSTIRFGSSVDDVVSFWVADSGPGVRDESLLFSRSTGLGLPIVKAIAQAHGGRVVVRSVPGEGATFVVEVPR